MQRVTPRFDGSATNDEGSMSTPIAETATGTAGSDGERKALSDGRAERTEGILDDDELFHLLQSERRRRAIRYLLAADAETIVMRDVAEAVAAEENDTTVALLGSADRQRVYITLYQSHLPQLADAGVITYDKDRGEITPTPLIEAFGMHLNDRSADDVDRPKHVWGATGLGLGTLLTLALVPAIGAVVTLGVVVLITAAVLAIGVGIVNGDWVGSS